MLIKKHFPRVFAACAISTFLIAWPALATLAFAQAPKSKLDIFEEEEEEEEPLGAKPPAAKPPAAKPNGPLPDLGGGGDIAEDEEAPLMPAPPKADAGGLLEDLLGGDGAAEDKPIGENVVDWVSIRSGPQVMERSVRLLSTWLGETPGRDGKRGTFTFYRSSGKGGAKWDVALEKVLSIEYYEQRMLKKAAEAMKVAPEELAGPLDLSDPDIAKRAKEAEKLLATALAQHDAAVQRLIRRGHSWSVHLREPLVAALFNLQRCQADLLLKQKNFRAAEVACDRIAEQKFVDDALRRRLLPIYEEIFLKQAIAAFKANDYPVARANIDQLTSRFPLDPGQTVKKVRDAMIDRARAVVAEAEREPDQRRRRELLEQAALIWPKLNGLEEQRSRLENRYAILECAYTTMPRGLTPLSARTPVEKHAVGLMFESLVRWTDDPETGPHYTSELAAGRPRTLAQGRRFFLPDCVWSDSTDDNPRRLIAEDVRRTMDILKMKRPPGYPLAWSGKIESVDASHLFEISIGLDWDYWQPLSFMDFMVLPRHPFPSGDISDEQLEQFEQNPVGSGPYRLLERDIERLRFEANPNYRHRDRMAISEIAFNRMELPEATQQLERGDIHVIYGLGREQVNQLTGKGERVVTLPARSVYFLAPNYRNRHIGLVDENYRLAIAHAIDRETILAQVFRPKGRDQDHAALHGPFPRNTWAYSTDVAPYHPDQAKVCLNRVNTQELAAAGPLKLVYPARDLQVEAACELIRAQLDVIGIPIELRDVEPEDFHSEIIVNHNFDLAYWRHDFPDETFWLWPLFDPDDLEPGGANFMGCIPDRNVIDMFKDLRIHKQFPAVQGKMHDLHRDITKKALIIPLWQLDTYVAIHESVHYSRLGPISLFEDIENWRIEKQGR